MFLGNVYKERVKQAVPLAVTFIARDSLHIRPAFPKLFVHGGTLKIVCPTPTNTIPMRTFTGQKKFSI
jgi:hypothetical protein